MEFESSSLKLEKLSNSNYYAWKQKIQHVLPLKDLEDFIEDSPPESSADLPVWKKKDRKAQAIIGLSLSNEQLENVRECSTAKDMWIAIQNVFERHTLLNKLAARRKFYTATMTETESVLQFSNRIRHLSLTLKSMSVRIDESEMAMALLNGLPDHYHPLISALDALGSEEDELKFEFIKSRVMQEEQRIKMRSDDALKKSETAALLSNHRRTHPRPKCNHCGRMGHWEAKCWTKHPHMNPLNKNKPTALVSTSPEDETPICLLAEHGNLSTSSRHYESDWYIDSGCSQHMTHDKSLFVSYDKSSKSSVELGNGTTTKVAGEGRVKIHVLINGRSKPCIIENVLHVPDISYQLLSVSQWTKMNIETLFSSTGAKLVRYGNLVATGSLNGSLY